MNLWVIELMLSKWLLMINESSSTSIKKSIKLTLTKFWIQKMLHANRCQDEITCFIQYTMYWMRFQSHVFFISSHVFHFVCFRILTDFWVNYIIFHSVSYFFYFQLQLICQTVKFCCVKSERCFNESLTLDVLTVFWLIFWSAFWFDLLTFWLFWLMCELWWMTLIETEPEPWWTKSTDTQLCTVRMIQLI